MYIVSSLWRNFQTQFDLFFRDAVFTLFWPLLPAFTVTMSLFRLVQLSLVQCRQPVGTSFMYNDQRGSLLQKCWIACVWVSVCPLILRNAAHLVCLVTGRNTGQSDRSVSMLLAGLYYEMMAGHHRTTIRLSALTDFFLACFFKSLYLSSHNREMAWKLKSHREQIYHHHR